MTPREKEIEAVQAAIDDGDRLEAELIAGLTHAHTHIVRAEEDLAALARKQASRRRELERQRAYLREEQCGIRERRVSDVPVEGWTYVAVQTKAGVEHRWVKPRKEGQP